LAGVSRRHICPRRSSSQSERMHTFTLQLRAPDDKQVMFSPKPGPKSFFQKAAHPQHTRQTEDIPCRHKQPTEEDMDSSRTIEASSGEVARRAAVCYAKCRREDTAAAPPPPHAPVPALVRQQLSGCYGRAAAWWRCRCAACTRPCGADSKRQQRHRKGQSVQRTACRKYTEAGSQSSNQGAAVGMEERSICAVMSQPEIMPRRASYVLVVKPPRHASPALHSCS